MTSVFTTRSFLAILLFGWLGCASPYEVSTSGGKYPITVTPTPTEFITPSQGEISKKIEARMQKIRACYEEGLAQDPNLVGKVIVNFLLQNTGKVSRIAVKDSTLHNPMVESCILYEVTKVAFPTFSKGAMEVTYPFLFKVKL